MVRSHLLTTIGLLVAHMDVSTSLAAVLQVPIDVVGVVVRVPVGVGVQRREGACLLRPSSCNVVRWRSLLQPISWVVLRLVVQFRCDKLCFDGLLPGKRCMRQRVRRSSWSRYRLGRRLHRQTWRNRKWSNIELDFKFYIAFDSTIWPVLSTSNVDLLDPT